MSGNFNGNSLIRDEDTGFLVPGAGHSLTGFTADKKVRFLEQYSELGSITAAIEAVGLNYHVYSDHMKVDKAFQEAFRLAELGMCHGLESTMYQAAKKENRYLDRITWLRAHHPNRNKYNPRVIHETKPDEAQLGKMMERMEKKRIKDSAVEGEVIDTKALSSTPPPSKDAP